MISAAQIRAARALLGIGIDELSGRSGLSPETITRIETSGGSGGDNTDLVALKKTLKTLGISFFAAGDCPPGGEGVRLTERRDEEDGLRPENLNATNDD